VLVFSQLPVDASLSAVRTHYLCSVEDFGHVITLLSCGTDFGIHNVVACVYSFGFAFKTGCDKVVPELC
jgi:hypothetical protein